MESESLEFELRTTLILLVFLGRLLNLSEPLSPLVKQNNSHVADDVSGQPRDSVPLFLLSEGLALLSGGGKYIT